MLLQWLSRAAATETVDELAQGQQFHDPKRAPPGGHGSKDVDVPGVGPRPWQGLLSAVLAEEEHAVFAPGVPHPHEHELPPCQGWKA